MSSLMGAVVRRIYLDDSNRLTTGARAWRRLKEKNEALQRYLKRNPVTRWCLWTAAVAAAALALMSVVMSYNHFARLETRSQALSAELGKELRRRENLIPNLVAVVGEYTTHEALSFAYVSDARKKLMGGKKMPPGVKMPSGFAGSLTELMALFEQYPQLKATQSAQDLIKELTETENRIARAKSQYNECARTYNQLTSMFPGTVLWRVYGFPHVLSYAGADKETMAMPGVRAFGKVTR